MNYSLSNFKIFSGSEPHTFELAPITMLIGENNSGKSTITKSLLLFKNFFDTIRKDFTTGYFQGWEDYQLDFTIGDHKLGSFENVLPFGSKDNEFKLGYTIKSEILEFCTQKAPVYDVEITFAKNIKDTTPQLCLQARIKEILIKIDGEIFYSYKNKKEKINLSSVRGRYIEILKSIFTQPQRRTRTAGRTFRGWVTQNPNFPTWKFQRVTDRLIAGGRFLISEEGKPYLDMLSKSIFPINMLQNIENFNAEEFEKYIENNINPTIDNLKLGAAIEGAAKNHFKWLLNDFKGSGNAKFGTYYQALEKIYLTNITNLIDDSNGESSNFIYRPWVEIVQKSVKDTVRDLTRALKFEYILSILSMPGKSGDDYTKHYYVQCLRNFSILLISEVFLLNDKLVDFAHLGLDRAGMHRLYTFKSQGDGFNRILANYMQQLSSIHFDKTTTYEKGEFMRKWLRKMTKFDDIKFEYAAEGEGVYISLIEKENKQTLADAGFGMTPLVAVMIQIELAILQMGIENHRDVAQRWQNGLTTIIIEEPESNLHPNYQAQLADLFVDAYKEYGIEFILETHSEYLARRMQVIVKEKGIEKDNIVIHNLKNGQDREIRIKEDGNLSQRFWPGFYSEATSLIGDLI